MTKKSKQKSKYLENEKSFWGEIKSIFHHFWRISIAKSFLRPESAPLIYLGYWRTNRWKYLEFEREREREREKIRHKFGGTKVSKAEEVRKSFVNLKIEIEVFSYIICSLDFKNISCSLFLLHLKTMNSVVSWYILALHHLFHFIERVSSLSIFSCFLSFFVISITC